MKVDFLGNVKWRAFVFAVTSAKVEGEVALTTSIKRGWNVDFIGDGIVGFASKSVIDERLW